MRFLYNLGIFFYNLMLHLAAYFNSKAKLWVNGRKNIFDNLHHSFPKKKAITIWIHSASLGEFEQGRPLIERIKQDYPHIKILLTFFSPSGYEIRKNYPLADYIFYLPIDSSSNAKKFIEITKPDLAIFIKYEFWYNYLHELEKKQVPVLFISSIFRPNQHFFKFYGSWFVNHLKNISHFFVQNQQSMDLLAKIGVDQVTLAGDTRFDRVAGIAEQVKPNLLVEAFKGGANLFLAGSSWPEDEKRFAPLQKDFHELKFIIAPHLIDSNHISTIQSLFENAILYSEATLENVQNYQVLIIDNMGMLSSLYQYADFALIGGGFGVGIHNTLEAATFGMPIFIGPNYHKFQEAKDLLNEGVAFVFKDYHTLKDLIFKVEVNSEEYSRIVQASKDYVHSKTGATHLILKKITEIL